MKVYFNNSCKICRSEINLYKKEKIEEIDWIDITNNEQAEKETNKNDKELLRRLHVKDNDKIFDPFSGSGIVPYIAKNLNRQYLGCEISEEVYNESIMKKMIQSDLTLL